MSASADPFHCSGCHTGDMRDFDHYCDVLGVPTDRTPDAFAAWLAGSTGWQGAYGETTKNTPKTG